MAKEIKELKDTIELMTSSSHYDRLLAEYYQLQIRTEKLESFIDKYKKRELDFTPNCSVYMLECQLSSMKEYLMILASRVIDESHFKSNATR